MSLYFNTCIKSKLSTHIFFIKSRDSHTAWGLYKSLDTLSYVIGFICDTGQVGFVKLGFPISL